MKRRRAGSALIEFAGSLIIVTALFTGIFQFSYALSTYQALVNAVRAGARYASLQPATPELAQSVRNVVVYGDPTPPASAKPMAPGLTPANVDLILDPGTATVSIRGFELASIFSRIKLDGRPTVTFPLTRPASK
jgi:Flp pilus assembly protein TadG